jgi:hypothetical protein
MSTPKRQPSQIAWNGNLYVLAVPYREWTGSVGETLSIGPLYEKVPPDIDHQYMPDLGYLEGITGDDEHPVPGYMHRIERGSGE